MDKNLKPDSKKPKYIFQMEAVYGPPSQSGFGTAVFSEIVEKSEPLESSALEIFKYFIGELWERYGEDAWMSVWKEVYHRQPDTNHDIAAELRGIKDRNIQQSVPMILEVVENADDAKLALSKTYDDKKVVDLKVYNLGDGEAMSGLLIAGRRSNNESTFLVFLMD
jgi:hypothetical protein